MSAVRYNVELWNFNESGGSTSQMAAILDATGDVLEVALHEIRDGGHDYAVVKKYDENRLEYVVEIHPKFLRGG